MQSLWVSMVMMCAPAGAAANDSAIDAPASALLEQAVANQYPGHYSCQVVWVENSLARGHDSLAGRADFGDSAGMRSLRLQNRQEAYEWWSRDSGQVQWWKNDVTDRLYRVPFHSYKKPAFGTLFTYEDLAKFPAGYFQDPESCKKLDETDSTVQLSVRLRPSVQSRYGYLDVTMQKAPVLVRRVVFFSPDGKQLKSLEVGDYRPEGGRFLPENILVVEGDSLASVRLSLSHAEVAPLLAGATPAAAVPRFSRLLSPASVVSEADGSNAPN